MRERSLAKEPSMERCPLQRRIASPFITSLLSSFIFFLLVSNETMCNIAALKHGDGQTC
ncbi:hypothetical protein Syun_010408 [Stephania yunnanensis]|uniref:Uncharacterized protein n=1 Tax=Stephania yunnanensis TaxID=152371 RepID=A0AAP0KIJ8_9MAGN